MSEFTYTAITKDGHRQTATIEAANLAAAGHALKEQGFLPTEISEKGKKTSINILENISTISLNEKINFIQNLSIMLRSGISISRALQILVKQTKNKKFNNILTDVYAQVEQGKGLSEALEKYPDIFPNIVCSMIKVGEVSGNLEKSLQYLSIQLQREADLKSKVRGAMIYPAVIVFAMFIIGILMSIFVLPSLTSVFTDQGVQLPFTTRMVIGFSHIMSGHPVLIIGGLIVFCSLVVAIYRTHGGKRAFDVASLHFFIINTIVKKINLARFARILSSLLKSGIPIVQGIEVAGQSLDCIPYKELLTRAAEEVRVGQPIAGALGKDEMLFPVLVVQMIQVGEESGTVQEILEQLADHYEAEVDDTLKNLSSIIEPLLILTIGGVVGVLALALFSPIYSIYSNASS